MPDPHRPLSDGKIAALKLLKLAYDDAEDAGEEPRQFAAKKDELMGAGATSSDLLWLLKLRYVEHVREVTRDGEARRQFRAATNPTLTQDSCFFLTYGGNLYVKDNGLHGQTPPGPASRRGARPKSDREGRSNSRSRRSKERGNGPAASSPASGPQSKAGEQQKLAWCAAEGNLYWRGQVILHLASWASAERDILEEFEAWRWESPIPNPIPRDATGGPTQSRRNAIYNLNRRLPENPPIEFFCLQGDLMGWRACA